MGLSALLIFWLAGRGMEKDDAGGSGIPGLAAIVFLSCFEVFGVGNTAVLDNLFALFLTAAIIAFYRATEMPRGAPGEKGWLVLAGLAAGMAFLTKGFLAFAVPVLVLAAYLIWQRRGRDIFRMGWLPVLVAVAVALPWSVAIGLREPNFWHFFIWNEHIRRFIGNSAQHKASIGYFFMIAPAMFMPWTFLAPAAVTGLRGAAGAGEKQRRLIRLCVCWLVLPFIFFSIAKGKLLTYILPCFPPFAILMAIGSIHVLRQGHRRWVQWGIAGAAGLFAFVLAAFLFIQVGGYAGMRPFHQPWKGMLVVSGFLALVLSCVAALRHRQETKKVILFAVSPMLLFFIAHFALPDQLLAEKAPGQLLGRCQADIPQDAVVVTDEDSVRAICWYLKRSDLHVIGGAGELDYGLTYPDAGGCLLSREALHALTAPDRGKLVLIARSQNIQDWEKWLPQPRFSDTSGPDGYSIWKY